MALKEAPASLNGGTSGDGALANAAARASEGVTLRGHEPQDSRIGTVVATTLEGARVILDISSCSEVEAEGILADYPSTLEATRVDQLCRLLGNSGLTGGDLDREDGWQPPRIIY